MDTIKDNQGTPNRRKVYNFLKANPELADKLLKLFDQTYDQLQNQMYAIIQEHTKDKDQETISAGYLLGDFFCETMEEDMGWPNLTALNNELPSNPITEKERELWIREISLIEKDYWEDGPDGESHKYDKLGNQLD